MIILPQSPNIEIGKFSRIFSNVSTSYKYLMMKGILELAPKQERITMNKLASLAVSYAWYSKEFYRLSYGPQDQMGVWIDRIGSDFANWEFLMEDKSFDKLQKALLTLIEDKTHSQKLKAAIGDFKNMVPYRLIAPWFTEELRGLVEHKKNKLIFELSNNPGYKPLYRLSEDKDDIYVHIDPDWQNYIRSNALILDAWWNWHFVQFLQDRNPTVLALANKLQPPKQRNMNLVKKLFEEYFNQTGLPRKCFYSDQPLTSVSHDHYMPWSFLGSDPIYNFVPSKKDINSSKSDNIPSEQYLDKLVQFQFNMFSWLRETERKPLEFFVNDLKLSPQTQRAEFDSKFRDYFRSLYLTAKNQGFPMEWSWKA